MSGHFRQVFVDVADNTNQIGECLIIAFTFCIGHMISIFKREQEKIDELHIIDSRRSP